MSSWSRGDYPSAVPSLHFNRVYQLSTKTENTAHSTRKFPKKMEIIRRICLFPYQPEWPGNRCTICELPLVSIHLGPFSRLSLQIFQNGCLCSEAMHGLWSNFAEHLRIPKSCLYRWVNSFGSQLVLFCGIERPKISSCGCKTRSIIKLSTIQPAKFIQSLYYDSSLTMKILYHYKRSIPTGFSVQMVNAPRFSANDTKLSDTDSTT